jgi:hypothetical protein
MLVEEHNKDKAKLDKQPFTTPAEAYAAQSASELRAVSGRLLSRAEPPKKPAKSKLIKLFK